MKATAVANSNIALIKYWGKRDSVLNLPQNSSISLTMDDQLSTNTTVEFDTELSQDAIQLDGKTAHEKEGRRITGFLDIVRGMARIKLYANVVSRNSFPKSAGLASSASGFAALAGAASRAAGMHLPEKELSVLARHGSGSACRSVFGGAVEWQKGSKKDGSDSFATPLSPPEKWTRLRNVIALVSPDEKKVSSRSGMEDTVRTSSLYRQRLKDVRQRLTTVRRAIAQGDFEAMAETIMQDSNSMHATMLDSWPPIVYMNDTSRNVMAAVLAFNADKGKSVAAYTLDAGPNVHIYTTEKYAENIRQIVEKIPGVQRMWVCGIGQGIRYSEKHQI